MEYNNSVFTLTSTATGDPFLVLAHDKCYLLFTAGTKRVVIWRCDDIRDFSKGKKVSVVWKPPPNTAYSATHWAPELHAINGRWYIYVGGASEELGPRSRRIYVLGGPPADQDPLSQCTSESSADGSGSNGWEFLGRVKGMPEARAIDATVLWLNDQLYLAYSGRAWADEDAGKKGMQSIFLLRLSDPTTASSLPVMIAHPQYPWEFTTDSGCNEGPEPLAAPDGSWRGLAFSAASACTPKYKMGTLQYLGGDPLSPTAWKKAPKPLLRTSKGRPPYGPGHGNFVTVGDQVLAVFHATDAPTDGLRNRKARVQRVAFDEHGQPYMGVFVGELTNDFGVFKRGALPVDPPMGQGGIRALFNADNGTAREEPSSTGNEVLFENDEDYDGDDRGEEAE